MSTTQAMLPPQVLVEKIKHLQEKYPSLDLSDILRLAFMKQDFALVPLGNVLDFIQDKKYYRYHFDKGISLKEMQKRCNQEKKGLCAVRDIKHLWTKSGDLAHPGGEILVLQGEMWGLCEEGVTIYPTEVEERISVPESQSGYDKFIENIFENEEIEDPYEEENDEENEGQGKGWFGESERHSKARKEGKADLQEDAVVPSAFELGKQTRLQKKMETLKQYIQARQSPTGQLIGQEAFKIEPLESITVPFSVMNTESGAIVQGEVVEGLLDNTIQMTPVSSSTVMASGMFHNELLVQFLPSGNTPQRTYRYPFGSPEEAKEAHESLLGSGSPGRWVWQNIRGHAKGEPVDASKLGPSLSPPGKGLPTIGGTIKSLVPYSISNRTPVGRVEGFEKMSKVLQRSTSNPALIPQNTRVEAQLQSRGALRSLGIKGFRTGAGVLGLPKLDFVLKYVGNVLDLTEDYPVSEYERTSLKGIKHVVKEHTRGEGFKKLYNDLYYHTKNTKKEKGYLIDKSGKITTLEGSDNEINPKEIRQLTANSNEQFTFIHSHPHSEIFSPSDIAEFIVSNKIRKIGIITPEGMIYELEKPETIEKYSFDEIAKGKEKYKNIIARARNQELSEEERIEFILNSFSIKYNLKYHKEKIKEDLTEDDALSECTSRGYEKEECFKFFNAAQTKATEKEKEPYRKEPTTPYSKSYDIRTLGRKLSWDERLHLRSVDKAVNLFPKKLFENAHPDILIVEEIPDHPRWKKFKGQIPQYYQRVGLTSTYDKVEGSYDPMRNECVVSLKNTKHSGRMYETVYHELAHAVWEYGGIPIHLKQMLVEDSIVINSHIQIDPYYKEVKELFALLFETHGIYQEERFKERSRLNENDAKMVLKTYKRIREWAEQ